MHPILAITTLSWARECNKPQNTEVSKTTDDGRLEGNLGMRSYFVKLIFP